MKEVGSSTGRGATPNRDWTKGSILRNLLMLSWPIIISQSLDIVGPTIDMIWVGKLGPASIAGVGVAGMAVMFVIPAVMGLVMGARAMIARFIGEGNASGANNVARQAFVISASFSIIMASIGIFFAESILTLTGVEPDVVAAGAAYMRIMFVGSVAMSFRITAEGVMQASGDAMTPMKIAVLFRGVHVALCPFLVFGWWIFPHLGVSGAAISNVLSQSLGLALGLWALFSGRTRLRLTLSNFHLDFHIMWRIVKIGIPAVVMGVQRSLGHLILMLFMVPFGTLAVAAHTLCQRIEMLLVMINMGFGMASGVLAGQNLGAGQAKRAERGGWMAAGFAEGVMVICSVAILLWAESIVGIFSTEPDLLRIASIFLRIAAAGYFVLGFIPVFMQCLAGVGDTLPPMLFELIAMWGVQLPLAYFLPRINNLGVYGVRWAMVAGMFVGAVAYLVYFRLGKWKHKKV